MSTKELDRSLEIIKRDITKLIALVYGDASLDEITKLSSFNKLSVLTVREKMTLTNYIHFLNNKYKIKRFTNVDVSYIKDEDLDNIRKYIDRVLTIVYLISLNKISIKYLYEYTEIIELIFSNVLANDYPIYMETFLNKDLLKTISRKTKEYGNEYNENAAENLRNIVSFLLSKYGNNPNPNMVIDMIEDINKKFQSFKGGKSI